MIRKRGDYRQVKVYAGLDPLTGKERYEYDRARTKRQAEPLAESLGKGDRVMAPGRLRQRSWETPEGEKRSATELEADEVGASLKWATAKVERASQRGNGDRSSGRERRPSAAAISATLRHSEPGSSGAQAAASGHGPRRRCIPWNG